MRTGSTASWPRASSTTPGSRGGVEQAVRTAGQLIWSNLTQSEDLLKVMLREPDELGDLDEKTWQVITDNAYQRFADELAASNRSGRTCIPDPEAAAAVAIGSLSYAATLQGADRPLRRATSMTTATSRRGSTKRSASSRNTPTTEPENSDHQLVSGD